MPTNYITLPRSQLYELVWSKPVRDVAKEFGISDVALAKRCRALNIPLPGRGYWARVAAGQKPKRPPLPPYHEVRASGSSRRTSAPADEPTVTFDPTRAADKARQDTAPLPELTTPAATDITGTLPIIRRTARHYRHPRRGELEFPRGEAQGPILRLHVSDAELERTLLLADRFLRAAAEQGWKPIPPKEPVPPDPRHYYGRPPAPPKKTGPDFADLEVDGKRIEFQIEERYEQRAIPPSEAELKRQKRDPWFRPEPHHETLWSGHLRLKRPRPGYCYHVDGKSWFETTHRTLDMLIPKILADFRTVAARMREVDEKEAAEERERERQAKLRAERAERRAANEKLIHTLEAQAGAWHRAQYLRRYVRAARRALGSGTLTVQRGTEPVDFLGWAEHYVNQLDPLHPQPRDPDFAHEHDFYYGAEEKRHRETLERLIGHTWEHTRKICADPIAIAEESDG
jgi:hypothetical protein